MSSTYFFVVIFCPVQRAFTLAPLAQGALVGGLSYGSLGVALQGKQETDWKEAAKWAIAGVVTGVAIAAIGSIAGTGAAVAAGLFAIPFSLTHDITRKENASLMLTGILLTSSVGYVLSLVNWPIAIIIVG